MALNGNQYLLALFTATVSYALDRRWANNMHWILVYVRCQATRAPAGTVVAAQYTKIYMEGFHFLG